MLKYCCLRNFLLSILVFIYCNLELLVKTFWLEKWDKMFCLIEHQNTIINEHLRSLSVPIKTALATSRQQ